MSSLLRRRLPGSMARKRAEPLRSRRRSPLETALPPGEARFRAMVESAPHGVVMVDGSGEIVFVNRETERLFGYTREELLGRPIEQLVPDRFRERHPGFRAAYFANPETRPMGKGRDLFGRRKDGSEIAVEIGLNPIAAGDGHFVLASIIDITDRKRTEERFQLVVEASPSAMIMIGADGLITLVNTQTEKLFGYGRQELLGQPMN